MSIKSIWKYFRIISIIAAVGVGMYSVLISDDPLDAYQKIPMPPMTLNALDGGEVSTAKWALESNGPKVINLFASWCVPCVKELPELAELSKHVPVYGIAWRDSPEDLKEWLAKHGNPYKEVGIDGGMTLIWKLGISGVPTTLLLDGAQKIVYIQEGVITKADIKDKFLPILERISSE